MTELEIPDPFEMELSPTQDPANTRRQPKWWYAQQLRMAGASWYQISQLLGYADEGHAQNDVHARKRVRNELEMGDWLDLELDRLDMLQLVCWRQAKDGDMGAINTVLKIMERRAKLLGLDKKPETETTHANTAIFIGGSEEEYLSALAKAREAVSRKAVDE